MLRHSAFLIALAAVNAIFISVPVSAADNGKERSIEFTSVVFQECGVSLTEQQKYKADTSLTFKVCPPNSGYTQVLLNFNADELIGRRLTLSAKVTRGVGAEGNFSLTPIVTTYAGSQMISNTAITQIAPDELFTDTYISDAASTVSISIQSYGNSGTIALSDIKLKAGTKLAAGTMCDQCKELLEEVLSKVDREYLWREKIDLNAIRSQLFLTGTGAKNIDALAPTIYSTLQALDPHSRYISRAAMEQLQKTMKSAVATSNVDLVQTRRLAGNIGYVKLFSYGQSNTEINKNYVSLVTQKMDAINNPPVHSWIVDLREHGGGSTFPLLAVMRRLLGKGTVGYFVDRNGAHIPWDESREDSAAYNHIVASHNEFDKPVALLQSNLTGSASEMLLIAFKGRPNTRFFGQPSWGLTTGVSDAPNKFGSIIAITSSYSADRNKKIYPGKIDPDVMVPPSANTSPENDEAIKLASEWISQTATQQKTKQ